MKTFYGIENIKIEAPTVLAIGKFDGVHQGHRELIKTLSGIKESQGGSAETCVFLLRGASEKTLVSDERRIEIISSYGVDNLVICDFTDEIKKMPAEVFLSEVIIKKLNAVVLAAGADIRFGAGGAGNLDFLREKSGRYGLSLVIIEKKEYRGEPISSSRIRDCISRGDREDADAMLGNSN